MRRWAHRTHLAGLFLAAAALACQPTDRATPPPLPPPPTSPGGVAVTDDAGRRVTLSAPARRIVSLSPAVTELLFALGAGDWVVGRTTWCDYPPAARAVPSVGDGLNPNLEAVAARRPDLVILYRSALNETAAQQLARLGIAAAVVRQDRLEDLARAAGLAATLTGRGAAGASLARRGAGGGGGAAPRLGGAPRGWLGLGVAAAAAFVLAVVVGPAHVPLANLMTSDIVRSLRLPRAILAFLVGGALALSGASLQALVRNPLADPFLLGLSGGAGLGAVLAIALRIGGPWALPLAAFAGALVAMGLVYRLGLVGGSALDPRVLILAGVAVGAFASAVTTAIVSLSEATQLRNAFLWLWGGLSGASWDAVLVAF